MPNPVMMQMIDKIVAGDLKTASSLNGYFDRRDMIKYARSVGLDVLGSGLYSVVMMRPGDDTVIKINTRSYDPWVLYAKYSMVNAHANSMLPVIYELYENEKHFSVARMEMLGDANIEESVGMGNVVRVLTQPHFTKHNISKRAIRNKALNLMKNWFDFGYRGTYSQFNLAKIVIWVSNIIVEHGMSFGPDFHGGNWMLRGDQLVLIDPIG